MNTTATRLAGYAIALVVLFGTAYGIGQFVGPVDAAPPAGMESGMGNGMGSGMASHDEGAGRDDRHDSGHGKEQGSEVPGGMQVSENGYTMVPVAAADGEFAFRITGPDGKPVTRYDIEHDKRMHLIVVRRDLSGFRHVHPTMSGDGTWRVAAPFGEPGSYRAYADFKPTGGEALTLGVDVAKPGDFSPRPLPAPAKTARVADYTVTIDGTLRAGHSSKLTLTVSRDGKPVTDLQPYLAAYGHLVALRQGDLAYLHVHPDGEPGDGRTKAGPGISFYAEVPSTGTYRLYLDFKHGGQVRTAEFTVVAGDE